jgi:hypothetical protein
VQQAVAIGKCERNPNARGAQGTHGVELRYRFGVGGRPYTGRRRLDAEGTVNCGQGAEDSVTQVPSARPARCVKYA